jgi:hypothetical protein
MNWKNGGKNASTTGRSAGIIQRDTSETLAPEVKKNRKVATGISSP